MRENTWTGVWIVFARVAPLLKKSATSTVKCEVFRASKGALCIEQCTAIIGSVESSEQVVPLLLSSQGGSL